MRKQTILASMAFPRLFSTFLVQFCLAIMSSNYKCNGQNLPKFSTILAFGDSVLDTGNNNYLNSIAKSNYPPYGIYFPGKIPTGRFSDGKLVIDLLATMLGIKEIVPPFLQPNLSNNELLTGVSFASAASGLDDQTFDITNVIPLSKQPGYLKDYIKRLTLIVGRQNGQRIVNEALVILHSGAVDFLYHFYVSRTNRRVEFSVKNYQNFLLTKLQIFLKELHDLGCRKIIVPGLPPLGCLPITMTVNSPVWRGCIEKINLETQFYNDKLEKLLPKVQAKLPGSKLVHIDTYSRVLDLINQPQKYGFVNTRRGCCGTGLLEFGALCNPLTPICRNSSQYLFWDSVHPTEAAYQFLAKEIYKKLVENNSP